MKLSILLCLFLAQVVFPHMPTVYEFCSHVVANGEVARATCDASQCQGRRGRVGPVGLKGMQGLKGQKGENGTSKGLEEKVRILEESLKRVETTMETVLNESFTIPSDPSMRDTVCYMGMKSHQIPDSAITSSSDFLNYAAHLGRLDNQQSGSKYGVWCAANNRVGEWIQVDLGHPEVVAGVITQGDLGEYWVTSYKVSCGNTDGNMATVTEHGADKVFSANTVANTKVVNKFPELMTCRYIRIYSQSYHSHTCMRLEIIRGICKDIY